MATQRLRAVIAVQGAGARLTQNAAEREGHHPAMNDRRIASHEWLAGGRFTAAHNMCGFPFGTMGRFMPVDISADPHLAAWGACRNARPAFPELAGIDRDRMFDATIGRMSMSSGEKE